MTAKTQTAKRWTFCLLKRSGDMLFAVAVALLLSAIVNQPTVVVHVIGHPGYLATEPEGLERVVLKIVIALFCLCTSAIFDHIHKEKAND